MFGIRQFVRNSSTRRVVSLVNQRSTSVGIRSNSLRRAASSIAAEVEEVSGGDGSTLLNSHY